MFFSLEIFVCLHISDEPAGTFRTSIFPRNVNRHEKGSSAKTADRATKAVSRSFARTRTNGLKGSPHPTSGAARPSRPWCFPPQFQHRERGCNQFLLLDFRVLSRVSRAISSSVLISYPT